MNQLTVFSMLKVQRSSLLTEFIPPKPDYPNGPQDHELRMSGYPMDTEDNMDAFRFDGGNDSGKASSLNGNRL